MNDKLAVPGTMPTLIADLTCAANGSYTENYIRALCERAVAALQSLESVREEALEEAAREIEPASGLSEDGTLLIRKGQAAIRALKERQSTARVAKPFDLKKHLSKPEQIIEIDEDGKVSLAPESPAKEQPGEVHCINDPRCVEWCGGDECFVPKEQPGEQNADVAAVVKRLRHEIADMESAIGRTVASDLMKEAAAIDAALKEPC